MKQNTLADHIRIKGQPEHSPEHRKAVADLKRLQERFGAEVAVKYYLAGLTFTEAGRAWKVEMKGKHTFNETMKAKARR